MIKTDGNLNISAESQLICTGNFFFEFFNFFKMFHTDPAQNYPQWQILPKKWLRLAQNGQFWSFCMFSIFFLKMRLRFTQNDQFYLIHNFFHLLSPKCLIFGEISKIFIPGWRYISNFFEFFNFSKLFHTKAAQNDPELANFTTEVA